MRFTGEAPAHDLTYSDVFLSPGRSDVGSRMDVDLSPGDGTPCTIPVVASNMGSVTGPRLAAVLARRGGIGILPQDLRPQEPRRGHPPGEGPAGRLRLAARAAAGRDGRAGAELLPPIAGHGIVLRDADGEMVGCLEGTQLAGVPDGTRLRDLPHGALASLDADDVPTGRAAFELMHAAGIDFAPVLAHGRLVGTLSRRSALRSTVYAPAVDGDGRLAVGAAVGVNGDPVSRAWALLAAGVDVIVLDTAHGHQESMLRAVRAVRALDPAVPLVAGNVVTAGGARDLVEAGADIVKVGVGPGAMCTTRMMTAVGRPQFSAVLDTAEAARAAGALVWADGGVRYPRDVALALAAGAASVMIGSWFAGTVESPGRLLVDDDGGLAKESWGMASTRAVQERFGRREAFEPRPAHALRGGDLDEPHPHRPAPARARGSARHDHLRRPQRVHLRRGAHARRVRRAGDRRDPVRGGLRGGQAPAGRLVSPGMLDGRWTTPSCS
ncbi:IMP dehydrogenase [Clavibacter tessellarius]|uniref:IMP dehydrogenase n=1 Tax=Clavibacter tessellarius TaxID=31965 RepID=UPI0032557561